MKCLSPLALNNNNIILWFLFVCFIQILYANEGECRKDLEVEPVQPAEKTNFLNHKGHEFIPTLYHFPANCEACAKPLWHVFKPPPAVECRRCHVKCHKDHLDKKEELIAPCKGMAQLDYTALWTNFSVYLLQWIVPNCLYGFEFLLKSVKLTFIYFMHM